MSELRVRNSVERLEVENVYCIGKNYLEHIREFDTKGKKEETPEEPVIFLKPNSSVTESSEVKIPVFKNRKISENLQNEVELVVIIGKDGINVPEAEAGDYVYGYAVGIDFTLRDLQAEFKKKGLPWTLSKGFLTAAPVSEIVRKNEISSIDNLKMCLKINGILKQDASTSQMIFSVQYLIHYISYIFGVKRGDIIFTGTPAGITKLNSGDVVEAEIEQIGRLTITVE
jgi:5-carboxymethyl-2-hydroxymuconate isomerase